MTRSSVRSASSLFDLGQGSDSGTKQSVQKENVGECVVKKAVGKSERKSDQHAGNEAGTYKSDQHAGNDQHAEVSGLQSKGLSQADTDAPTSLAEQLHAVSTHTEEKDLTHSQDVVVMPMTIMAMPVVEKICCLVLDVNGLLLTRNRLFKGGRGKRYVPKAGFEDRYLLIEPQGFNFHPFVQYVVRKDALKFLQSCLHQSHVVLWSSMTEENMHAAMEACFPSLPVGDFLSVMSQRNCKTAEFTFSDLPSASIGGDTKTHIFLKCLADIWSSFPFLNADNTLLVDDTLYTRAC